MNAHAPVVALDAHRSRPSRRARASSVSAIALGDWPRAAEAADGLCRPADPGPNLRASLEARPLAGSLLPSGATRHGSLAARPQ